MTGPTIPPKITQSVIGLLIAAFFGRLIFLEMAGATPDTTRVSLFLAGFAVGCVATADEMILTPAKKLLGLVTPLLPWNRGEKATP